MYTESDPIYLGLARWIRDLLARREVGAVAVDVRPQLVRVYRHSRWLGVERAEQSSKVVCVPHRRPRLGSHLRLDEDLCLRLNAALLVNS